MHINEIFEKQVKNNPHGRAVVCNEKSITYQELDKKANQFSHYLRETYHIRSGDIVGLPVESKDINLFVALLGVLKAGAAYQLLDVNQCSDSIIALSKHLTCIIGDNQRGTNARVSVSSQIENWIKDYSESPLGNTVKAGQSIAYLVSTSGTTGKPKTIAISHDNIIATFHSWKHVYQLNPQDRHLQMANFLFDVFTGDWVRALCSGGTLVLCPKKYLLNPEELFLLIEKHQITIAEFVPAVLRKMLSYLERRRENLSTFRLLICGSDIWYVGECKKLMQLCDPKPRVINSYGLAETTIDSTYFEYSEENSLHLKEESIVPIGKAFPHAIVQIITPSGEQAKTGEQGEIYIGGQGVSSYGYLNNSELTEKKFIRSKEGKNEFYKTGDIAEILHNGDVLFLGRNETQFNIHGQRVDFLSVESALLQHPAIKSALVIPNMRTDRNFLEAFLILNLDITYEEVRNYLKDKLPAYAVPRYFYEIEAVVLNDNDKIVRDKYRQRIVREIFPPVVTPTTRTQLKIAKVWEEALQQKPISINHSFDLLGGTSLEYAKIITEVNKIFHIKIDFCKKLKTIVEMAAEIDSIYNPDTVLNPYQCQEM